jgi:hypothetical protein
MIVEMHFLTCHILLRGVVQLRIYKVTILAHREGASNILKHDVLQQSQYSMQWLLPHPLTRH